MNHRRLSFSVGHECRRRAAVAAMAVPIIATASLAVAEDVAPVGQLDAVTIYHAPVEQRRIEVMNVLSTSVRTPPPADSPRRRLSREERDVLNRELREVLRSAYQTRMAPAD